MKTHNLPVAIALGLTMIVSAGCASAPSIRDANESVSMDAAASGKITAIDATTRKITVRGEEGNEVIVNAGEGVRNFSQLAVGDVITLMYRRAVAFDLQPAGSGEPGAYLDEGAVAAKPGQKPGGAVGETVTVLAPIVAIDRTNHIVSVRGPAGNIQMIDVLNPVYQKQLGKLKIGDLLRVSYTEAMAISVTAGSP